MWIFICSSRRRHTRYWRDWSSDVCSSDLFALARLLGARVIDGALEGALGGDGAAAAGPRARHGEVRRSEERRVGNGRTCRWQLYHQKKFQYPYLSAFHTLLVS